jgi:transforming growth factor-beta-induced protein
MEVTQKSRLKDPIRGTAMKISLKLYSSILLSFFLVACGGDDNDPTPSPTPTPAPTPVSIVDIASGSDDFDTLVFALTETGLADDLADLDGTFTVFAPTDEAFDNLPDGVLDDLLDNPDQLADVLRYHVLSGTAADSTAASGLAGETLTMLNGDLLAVSLSGTQLYLNTSAVTTPNLTADNGIIHVIDKVLIPPTEPGTPTQTIAEIAAGNADLETLVEALTLANLVDTLDDPNGNFTVFAPTDAAFALVGDRQLTPILEDGDTLNALLLQHVLPLTANSITAYTLNGGSVETESTASVPLAIVDGELQVAGVTVTTVDIYASNGVIHLVDEVIIGDLMLPPAQMSITEVAQGADSLSTLVSLLQQTGLDATLDDLDTDFTVFAPSNDAFAALGELNLTNEQLINVLEYHVVGGAVVDSTAALDLAGEKVTMANGDMASISYVDPDLHINLSKVTTPNVMATNGVAHIVDKVMLPPAMDPGSELNIVETAEDAGSFSVLLELLSISGLDAVLSNEAETYTVFAPTDDAFDMIPLELLVALVGDADKLEDVLLQHVLAGQATSLDAFTLNGTMVGTAGGAMIDIAIDDGDLYVGGAKVTTFDIYTNNGVIHVIDTVIVGDVELPKF